MQIQAVFLRWLTRTLLGACYPGSPFERKSSALRLLGTLLACWQQPVAAGLKVAHMTCLTCLKVADTIARPASSAKVFPYMD